MKHAIPSASRGQRWRRGLCRAAASVLAALVACAAMADEATMTAQQKALDAAGPQAQRIESLWHLTLGICTVVFALVLAAFLYALWRAPRADASTPADIDPSPQQETRARRSVTTAVMASAALLLFLIVASVLTDRALARLGYQNALHIEVTASQWWWEMRYDDGQASRIFTTANEMHIPTGRPVIMTLRSTDVIHSLWVPNLHGKKDLIPGRTATLHLQADKPGVYRGQCAEFCGYQHSKMALVVVAEAPDRYEAWAQHQRQSAPAPADPQAIRGRDLFLGTSCVMCHSIQGTIANAKRAPDLTHMASRETIGAGTLPNTAQNLERWIRDPQAFKPGANMPPTNLPPEDLRALVAYLETLQ